MDATLKVVFLQLYSEEQKKKIKMLKGDGQDHSRI